ncbi:uncharacterized protein RAG0_05289 [Rhynchosporium agropyri]|uniref:Uncharacterized protein n=1 Tax=Rhynchosporium agropyri TaxID=914238 RepID=A0A1E1KCG3_9HELO|nr:uncharacterized protein RAG0_05289 [Rhynchosporium agropyri]
MHDARWRGSGQFNGLLGAGSPAQPSPCLSVCLSCLRREMAVALSRVHVEEVQVQVLNRISTEREAIYLYLTARRHTTRPKDDGWIIAILAKSLHHVGVPRD